MATPVTVLNALDYIPPEFHDDLLARSSTVDVALYLQQWLDEGAAEKKRCYLPAGRYTCGQALYVTRLSEGFETGHVVGDGGGYTDVLSQSTLVFTQLDQPGLIVDRGRGVRVAHIQITGQNTVNAFPPSDDPANYRAPGVRAEQQSPYAGIAIDGTLGPAPADGGYPGLAYGGAVNSGSKNIRIEHVSVRKFNVGIVLSPNNSKQAEQVVMDTCSLGDCEYGVSVGQAQARGCVVSNTDIEACRIGLAGSSHGAARQGVAPIIENCQFVLVHRGFEFSDQFGACYVKGCYFEQINVLGTFGYGFSQTKFPLTIRDCSYHFLHIGDDSPPIVLESQSATLIEGTKFLSNDQKGKVINFVGRGRIQFNTCVFNAKWLNDDNRKASIAQRYKTGPLAQSHHSFANCLVESPSDISPVVWEQGSSELSTIDLSNASEVHTDDDVTFVTTYGTIDQLFLGQLAMYGAVKQGRSNETYILPSLEVVSIDLPTKTIVCKKLFAADQYNITAYQGKIIQFVLPDEVIGPSSP